WLALGKSARADRLPRIFYVNWFRKDEDGRFLWPGFGENSRVLEWVFRRCEGTGQAQESPIGRVPVPGAINTEGLKLAPGALEELLRVDPQEWKAQLPQFREHLAGFENLPDELREQLDALAGRLGD
ncbi:MAG TPA: phosphoenolpyruvate carboxykinase domain-containing protein, partial [Solirubrobacteraceae bacterium]|nr:phosphoenolpyruvate carboxykinase domain-containing protein [Solirubrobacteraceae bacterium]